MFIIKTYLGPDQYGGTGLFAGQAVKKGDVVWRYTEGNTKFYTVDEYKRLITAFPIHAPSLKKDSYPAFLEWNGVLQRMVCRDLDNGTYTNHSDDPNIGTITDPAHPLFHDNDGINIALRDIAKGDEITYDYFEFVPDFNEWRDIETCIQFLMDMDHPRLVKCA